MQQPDIPTNNPVPSTPSVQPKTSRLAIISLATAILMLGLVRVIFDHGSLEKIGDFIGELPGVFHSTASVMMLVYLLILMVLPILCGHMALAKIKRSMGVLIGKRLAIAGLVLGYLLTLMFCIAARAYKRGCDRAGCIVNQRNVQQALRSYQSVNNRLDGPIDWNDLIGPGKYLVKYPVCPAHGNYTFKTTMPEIGEMAVECSLSGEPDKHEPENHHDW